MMPFTATRHPAVLFLSGINVTTPSASVIGSALTHTHLLILDSQSVPKPHKNNHFPAKETLLYLLATASYYHLKLSQISTSEPLQNQLAIVCHQRQRICPDKSRLHTIPLPLTSINTSPAFIIYCHSGTIRT